MHTHVYKEEQQTLIQTKDKHNSGQGLHQDENYTIMSAQSPPSI